MPYLFIASDRHVEGPCAPYLVVAISEVTHARHPLQLAIPIPLASIFARCTRHIRQRLITISLLLQGSASCFPKERGTTVCCNEELLRSSMTSRSWEAQPPFFGRATLMRSTKSEIHTSPCFEYVHLMLCAKLLWPPKRLSYAYPLR
jgi:hypothetical protein